MARREPPNRHTRPILARMILAAILVAGAAEARGYNLIGNGTDACGSWAENRREYASGRPVTRGFQLELRQTAWVVGFLSGVGYMGATDKLDPLRHLDADRVWAWIDTYCQAHPLERIVEAAKAFVAEHPR